jgi:tRNA dimethylallyltransferase
MTPALHPLLVILGPTASGKSALGIALAGKLNGEVIVCDSTQVYRHFDIGTAKVPVAEQKGIPHHLIDLVEPDQLFTAGEYRRRALIALEEVKSRGKLPIITAGTGLYLRALLEGLADAPERSEELRTRLRIIAERRGAQHLHKLLERLDQGAANRIALRDTQKVIRAVEIRLLAGKSVSSVHGAGREPLAGYRTMKIGLLPNRKALYSRIEQRTTSMIRQGWLGEVGDLIAKGTSPNAKAFQFIGYAELREVIAGKLTEPEAIERIQQSTRQFAKRQITWFRREPGVHWLEGFGDGPSIEDQALEVVNKSSHET